MSICSAVTPFEDAGDLEVHVAEVVLVAEDVGSTTKRSPSFTRPIAMPATGALTGTPASISASEEPQTEAIDEEPFDSVISDTTRMVYGNDFHDGITAHAALGEAAVADLAAASGAPKRPVSPTEYGGKL